MLNTLFYSVCPTCFNRIRIVLGFLLHPNAPQSVAVHRRRTSMSHPLPTSSPGTVRCPPGHRPNLQPTIFRRSSL